MQKNDRWTNFAAFLCLAVVFAALGFFRVESPSAYIFKYKMQKELNRSEKTNLHNVMPGDWDTVCQLNPGTVSPVWPSVVEPHITLDQRRLIPNTFRLNYRAHFVLIKDKKIVQAVSLKRNKLRYGFGKYYYLEFSRHGVSARCLNHARISFMVSQSIHDGPRRGYRLDQIFLSE